MARTKRTRQRNYESRRAQGATVGPGEASVALPYRLRHFVLEYLSNGQNVTAAYDAAFPGCKRTTCASEGWKLLRKPEIAAVIQAEQTERCKRLKMDADEALALIAIRARADIGKLFDEQGELLPINQWPEDIRLCVKSIKPGPFEYTVTLHDSLRAAELMAQAAGALKHDVQVNHAFDLEAYLVSKSESLRDLGDSPDGGLRTQEPRQRGA